MIAEKADDLLTIRNLRMASRITEIGATKTLFRSLTKMPTAVGVQDLKKSIAKDHRLCHRVQSLSLYASDDIQEVSMNDIYAGPVNTLATNMQEKFLNLSELTVKVDDAFNDLLWDKPAARIAMQSLTEAVSLSKARGPKKLHLKAEDHCFQPENFNAQGWPWDDPAEFLAQFTEIKIDVNCCSCDPGVFIYDKLLAQSNHLVKLDAQPETDKSTLETEIKSTPWAAPQDVTLSTTPPPWSDTSDMGLLPILDTDVTSSPTCSSWFDTFDATFSPTSPWSDTSVVAWSNPSWSGSFEETVLRPCKPASFE